MPGPGLPYNSSVVSENGQTALKFVKEEFPEGSYFFIFELTKMNLMALPTNDKGKRKKGNKSAKPNPQGSKFIPKQGKSGGFTVRPHKAGGTRGS
jgi:hypothetical protein